MRSFSRTGYQADLPEYVRSDGQGHQSGRTRPSSFSVHERRLRSVTARAEHGFFLTLLMYRAKLDLHCWRKDQR